MHYCKFENDREGFIFLQNFVKMKPSRNGDTNLLLPGVGNSCSISFEHMNVTYA